jgi:hypothetical protein
MGLLLIYVFLGWGRLVFDSWWTFILIWVPLIMVPDSVLLFSECTREKV